ncbi:MAG TPA: hypothetical protein VFI76_01230 [Terrimicrobiaceae bacterium]|nr:hypothetical protein [Terrimicrobiaceae bacterium]
MNRTLQPVETEYSGVVFRSKTEAIFARCLDLAGAPWTYEPLFMTCSGCHDEPREYVPDFYVSWPRLWRPHSDDILCSSGIIEIKPSRPTETWIKRAFTEYQGTVQFAVQAMAPLYVYFDLWTTAEAMLLSIPMEVMGQEEENPMSSLVHFLWEHWDEAKSYRFDLA